jgi:hypothetical protein
MRAVIAGAPDRHEPDDGELNYRYLFSLIDRLGYAGWIGCEYRPAGRTEDGLSWIERLTAREQRTIAPIAAGNVGALNRSTRQYIRIVFPASETRPLPA